MTAKRSEQIKLTVRLSKAMSEELASYADSLETSKNNVVKMALRKLLKQPKA